MQIERDQFLFDLLTVVGGEGVGDMFEQPFGKPLASSVQQDTDVAGGQRFPVGLRELLGDFRGTEVGTFGPQTEDAVVEVSVALGQALEFLPGSSQQFVAPALQETLVGLVVGLGQNRRPVRR